MVSGGGGEVNRPSIKIKVRLIRALEVIANQFVLQITSNKLIVGE